MSAAIDRAHATRNMLIVADNQLAETREMMRSDLGTLDPACDRVERAHALLDAAIQILERRIKTLERIEANSVVPRSPIRARRRKEQRK